MKALLTALLLLIPATLSADPPPAVWDAIASISCDNGRGGSGVLVESCNGSACVITAQHVMVGSKSGTVTFPNGESFRFTEAYSDKLGYDQAAIYIQQPKAAIAPLRIVSQPPKRGERVYMCGYGSEGKLAGLVNTVNQIDGELKLHGGVRSGDSGGPVLNERGEVIGINSNSTAPGVANQSNGAVPGAQVAAFFSRLQDKRNVGLFGRRASGGGSSCGPNGCPGTPQQYQGAPYQPAPYQQSQQLPPGFQYEQQPAEDDQPQPQPQDGKNAPALGNTQPQPDGSAQERSSPAVPVPATDYEKLASLVADKVGKAHADKFTAIDKKLASLEAGACKCDLSGLGCKCKEQTPPDIDALAAAVKAKLLADQSLLTSLKGKDGKDATSPAVDKAAPHIVIVADKKASYWERLDSFTRSAKDVFSSISVAPPPDYPVGALPQAVVYRGATPEKYVKGQTAVEELLIAVRRGEVK